MKTSTAVDQGYGGEEIGALYEISRKSSMRLILCQGAKALGATIVGTVSTEAKVEAARAAGCDHPVVCSSEDLIAKVREMTDGEGAAVVY